MRQLIICDKNKSLIKKVKELIDREGSGVYDTIQVIEGDVTKVHKKTHNSRIVTASNPQFSPDGGLDMLLAKKYGWDNPSEFSWNDHLFFVKSVDDKRRANNEIIKRAFVGVFGYSSKFTLILTGIGTGVGGLDEGDFLKQIANLREADLQEADLWKANLQGADLWGANLQGANLQGANLWGANLQGANLREADLQGANLQEADLQGANLWEANLRGANLQGANLWGANLQGANLRGAENIPPLTRDSLDILRLQKNPLIAYKFVKSDFHSPVNGNIEYKVGKTIKEEDCDSDDRVLCGRGLNVATLEWCLRERNSDQPIIEVAFNPKYIVSIPYNTDGKFRVSRLKVLRVVPEEELKKVMEPLYSSDDK